MERIDAARVRVAGIFPVDDLNEQLGLQLPPESFHTIGGLVFGRLGRAPHIGDEVEINAARVRVLDLGRSRIARLEIELPQPAAPSE